MYQYALVEDGMTIHSSPQMEWNQVSVDDWSWVGGHQCLLTLDGYQRPLNMHCGQAYSAMDMCPLTDKDWDHLSHVTLMLKTPWDPWVLDLEQSNHRHNLRDWLATPYLQSSGLHKVYHSDLTHNVSQLVCEKSSFWGGGDLPSSSWRSTVPWRCWVWCKGMLGTDCHQYKSTSNMHEKAKPISNIWCPHVLDVNHGTQSPHHGGITMLCLSSTYMYQLVIFWSSAAQTCHIVKNMYIFNLKENE
jgi:hypothetical protein